MTQNPPPRAWESAQAAEIWRQGAARRAQTLAKATERLLDAAAIGPGMRVLDVAAGSGDQTIPAARRVGAAGEVLATDISAAMLASAEQSAREAGLSNVATHVSDASRLDVPESRYDAAICRFGLMFVPDLHQALSGIHRALKPGARFATLVWAPRARNPWMGIQVAALTDIGRAPPPEASVLQAVSLGDAGTLDGALGAAGFRDVHTEAIETPRRFDSVAEATQAMQVASPTQGDLLRQLSEPERARFQATLHTRIAAFAQPDGRVEIPGEAILGVGTR